MNIDLILAIVFVAGCAWLAMQIAIHAINYDERRDARRRNQAHPTRRTR